MIKRVLGLFSGTSTSRQLARGSAISFVLQAAGAGLIFLSEVVLARALQAEGYGLYATVFAWLQVLVLVALLGSNHLLVRYVPAYLADREWSLLRGVIGYATRTTAYISAAILVLTLVLFFLLQDRFSSQLRWAYLVGIMALPLFALSLQRQAILRGLHCVGRALSPEYLLRPLLLIAFVSVLAWGIDVSLTAPLALALNGVAILLTFLLGWYWLRRSLPVELKAAARNSRPREWLAVSLPLFVITCMQLLIVRMDIILLGSIEGPGQAGIYAAASRVSDLVVFALAAANAIVAPMISAMHARNDMAGLQKLMTQLAKGVLAFTLPLVLSVVMFGDTILAVFGPDYPAAYTALLILVFGQMVNALSGPVDFMLYMTGHQKQSMFIFALATLLNLLLNLALIPHYGLQGAAIATATTTVFWNSVMRYYVRKKLGIEASVLVLLRKALT